MNLTKIAQAVNTLCHDLAPRGAQPPSPSPNFLQPSADWDLWNSLGPWMVDDTMQGSPIDWNALDTQRKAVEDFCKIRPCEGTWTAGYDPSTLSVKFSRLWVEELKDWNRQQCIRGHLEGTFALDGWWAKIGGMPPVFQPHSVTLEQLQASFGAYFTVREATPEEVRDLDR